MLIFSRLTISRLTKAVFHISYKALINKFDQERNMTKHKPPDTLDFLLANICSLHHVRVHQLLDALGLYRGQPHLLRALWEQEGPTQTDLAEYMKITTATMTKMIQRMEKAGFIQRKPDPDDQRISRVYLTDVGRAVQQDVEAVWVKMNEETFAGFTDDELALLRHFLLQIRLNLGKAAGEEPWT